MEYNYAEIEKKWQKYWVEHKSGRAVTTAAQSRCSVKAVFRKLGAC